ncbi:NB-ARC domain-containing protein [Streptomyces galbus]|uniref:Tetratricopeptide repeat protein n=1 Tax=Streptomyces galbus TaxID=33898 RepID=A0A4U5X8G0_STRGB|nr:NB-ARC domain-containing protein [Streptomyces galbus]TKT09736.1 tetratricopeptide repeat protein [Streptomyces galbus]
MVRLGGASAPRVGASTVDDWLNGRSVPGKKSESFLLHLVGYLRREACRLEAGSTGSPASAPGEQERWLRLVRAARRERGEESPGGRPRNRTPGARPAGPVTLPPPPPDFAGRTAEVAEVLRWLRPGAAGVETASAVVVSAITGMGGVGKTALALHAAHEAQQRGWFPGGALFADLRGYSALDPVPAGAVADRLLRAMGVPVRQLPGTESGALDAWRRLLHDMAGRNASLLVVLDNVRDPSQVGALLPEPPHRALITSRQALGSLPVHRVDVAPLPTDEAVMVLDTALRAGETQDPRCSDDPAGAEELAGLCGGLPLALRITAALLRTDPDRPLSAHAEELRDARDRLDALSLEEEDTEGRPLAVRASLDLSYHHLPAAAARALRLLATCPGPDISTSTAAVVLGLPRPLGRRHLAVLARHHLIGRTSLPTGQAHAPRPIEDAERWALHDLVRLYGTEQAERHRPGPGPDAGPAEDEVAAAAQRLDDHCTALTAAADALLDGRSTAGAVPAPFGGAAEALAWLDAERANLVALVGAARRADRHRTVLTLTLNLQRYQEDHWQGADAYLCGTHAEAAARNLPPADHATALATLGNACRLTGRLDEAVERLSEAAEAAAAAGRPRTVSAALHNLGLAHVLRGDLPAAEAAHRCDIDLSRRHGDRRGEAMALVALADVLHERGGPEAVTTELVRAAHLFHDVGDRRGSGMVALRHARTALRDLRAPLCAAALCGWAVHTFRQAGAQAKVAVASIELGAAYWQLCPACYGAKAIRWTRDGAALAETGTDDRLKAQSTFRLGSLLARSGDRTGARAQLERTAAVRAVGDGDPELARLARAARSVLAHLGKPKSPLLCAEAPAQETDRLVDLVEGIARGDTPATSLVIVDPVWLALIGAGR